MTHQPRRTAGSIEAVVLGALVLAAAWVQIDHFVRITSPRQFNDTASYVRGAELPLLSAALWFGENPPLTPVWLKLVGRDPETVVRAQMALSLAAWSVLALVAASTLRRRWLRPAACALVLALSLSAGVTQWHATLLSDSLSLSILALLAGAWIAQLRRGGRASRLAVIVLGALYALARDTNAYTLALVAVMLAAAAAYRSFFGDEDKNGSISPYADAAGSEQLPSRGGLLVIAAVYAAVFPTVVMSMTVGERWVPAFYNNVSQRVLPYPERIRWFESAGMPVSDALIERRDKWAWDDESAYFVDPRLAEFRDWVREHGRDTYVRFLVEHARYSLFAPLADLRILLHPRLGWMYPDGYTTPLHVVPGAGTLLSPSLLPAYFAACGILLAVGLARSEIRRHVMFRAGAALLALSYPGVLLAWHASPMEIERHALHSVMLARLGFVFWIVAVLDCIGGASRRASGPGLDLED